MKTSAISLILCSVIVSSCSLMQSNTSNLSKCSKQVDDMSKKSLSSTCTKELINVARQQGNQFQRNKTNIRNRTNAKDASDKANVPICGLQKDKPYFNSHCKLEKMIHEIYDHTHVSSEGRIIDVPYDLVYLTMNPLVLAKNDGKYGFIDNKSADVAIAFKYEHAQMFSEGLAPVMLAGKYGFIDTTGKMVIKNNYDYAYPFAEGLAVVVKNNKYGYINKAGKQVIPMEYELAMSFHDGMAPVKKNGLYGYIQPSNKLVIPYQFYSAKNFYEGFAVVANTNDKFGFINTKGKLISDYQYDYAYNFQNGLANVAIEDDFEFKKKHGFINTKNQVVIPMIYDSVDSFYEEYTRVQKGNRYGIINRQGKIIVPIKYTFAYVSAHSFTVKQSNHFFELDTQGKPIPKKSLCYEMKEDKGMQWVAKAYECSSSGKKAIDTKK